MEDFFHKLMVDCDNVRQRIVNGEKKKNVPNHIITPNNPPFVDNYPQLSLYLCNSST